MKVGGVTTVEEFQRTRPAESPATDEAQGRQDRVSVASSKSVDFAIATARSSSGGAHSARLDQLAAQVKSGGYQPSATQVAQQILADAEVDAQIQAMLNH